ncbi:protein TPX2 isoform X3 [Brachypodium distachyon]|uniref:protein TPX2 isoform X3 n=1 Tax=Brachypodium distachyon TaxID=15368 RepID=UPI00071DA162|nr:protein TPX2 isoform X3 [Brachypodium distachyon]|eukprot:XP_014752761.1 protein TPX2 isoform X3 [Brachypodium distachyon]
MATETKPSSGTTAAVAAPQFQVDEAYEYRAPKYFDFVTDETEDDVRAAERWFEASASHAPSPFAPRIKESRAEVKIDGLCDFADAEEPAPATKEATEAAAVNNTNPAGDVDGVAACPDAMLESPPTVEEEKASSKSFEFPLSKDLVAKSADGGSSTPNIRRQPPPVEIVVTAPPARVKSTVKTEACTPKVQANASKGGLTDSKIMQTSDLKQSSLRVKKSVIKGACDSVARKASTAANDIAQENQAVKRQKLEDGRTREILNVKTRLLPHKGRGGLAGSTEMTLSSMRMRKHHDDAHSLKEVSPYISAAEMVKKFESGTRGSGNHPNRSMSHEDAGTAVQRKPKLVLTRPKEPEFQTTHRVRAVRMKSSAELEEEMLAKIPKFRARPFNRKIAEAPSFPPLPRKAPQLPEFNEFHLKTMERASRHADTCSETSSVGTMRFQGSKTLKMTEAKPPQLETALRARPSRVKSSQELELEELEKAPKFKARPLNKKILESKGDIGVFAHPKPQATEPKEFHFCTDDRLGPPPAVMDLFDKLSLYSESTSYNDKKDVPRVTIPNPFNLHTDERGHEKERQLEAQLMQKKLEEEKARKFKANPYPYTTDYPVVPPKPDPKPCTRPEGFQLESLVRHELEQQRFMEERERMEREEAQRRLVKAQPILKEDPIPLPEKERKPLTEVQQFQLHVDERAVQRSEFDTMLKEKEITYKRLREENEFAQKIEEEKALKQLRRTLVPQARPLPKFDRPFRPQRSMKQVTRPKSPQLQVNERGARRHAFIR